MLNGLTLPPRLVLRALDDLHTLAEFAKTLPAEVTELQAIGRELLATGREIQALGLRIEEQIQGMAVIGENLDRRGEELLAQASSVEGRLDKVIDALPTIEAFEVSATTLAQTVVPLQGVADRLGRITDRLPGARPRP